MLEVRSSFSSAAGSIACPWCVDRAVGWLCTKPLVEPERKPPLLGVHEDRGRRYAAQFDAVIPPRLPSPLLCLSQLSVSVLQQ